MLEMKIIRFPYLSTKFSVLISQTLKWLEETKLKLARLA